MKRVERESSPVAKSKDGGRQPTRVAEYRRQTFYDGRRNAEARTCIVLRDFVGQEENLHFFIDRDPHHFGLILDHLRKAPFILPSCSKAIEEIKREAQFYCLDDLLSVIRKHEFHDFGQGPIFPGDRVQVHSNGKCCDATFGSSKFIYHLPAYIVTISGFRSYRDNTTIDDFSRKHNVVVGRNGSGKSNFFFAVQFLLSDEYAHLKSDFKLGLMHEGTGARVQTARVEIVFDNSDRRIVANDCDEVRVSRQIGNKKDQYYIDGKTVARSDVVNLMESAGFSRSNPYYIVKQGKINELATAPDSHRLKLLKEVAGTRVYDERKEESEKILEETKEKKGKVESLITFIEDRLKTLESEKEDLKEYQKWDKTKRSVEYTIYEAEIREAKDKLDTLAVDREEVNKKQNQYATQLVEVREKGNEEQKNKRKLDQEFKKIKEEKESLSSDKEKLVARKAELSLQIDDLDEDVKKSRENKSRTKEKLAETNAKIAQHQEQLEKLRPKLEQLLARELALKTDINIAKDRSTALFGKQGDTNRFKSNDERRAHFARELKRTRGKIGETTTNMSTLEDEIGEHEREHEKITNDHDLMRRDMEQISDELGTATGELQKRRQEEQGLVAKLRDAELEEREIMESVESNEHERQRLSSAQKNMGPRGHVNGMANLRALIEEMKDDPRHQALVNGYYGHVIDHLEAEETYFQAIELNFIPLNRMHNPEVRQVDDEDARSMIEIINFDESVRPAFEFIFGKMAIIRTLEVGVRIAKTFGVDCVTLEGDQVARRGAMTGGWQDARISKLEARQSLRKLEEMRNQFKANLAKVEQRKHDIHKSIVKLRHAVNTIDDTIRKIHNSHRDKEDQKRNMQQQINELQKRIEMKKTELTRETERLRVLQREESYLVEEENKDLASQISSQETNEIKDLQREMADKTSELRTIEEERRTVEREKNKAENYMNTTLLRKKEEYESVVNDISTKEQGLQLTAEREELNVISAQIADITKKIGEIEERLEEYDAKNEEYVNAIENYSDQQRTIEQRISDLSRQAETIVTKQSMLQTQKEEASKKARELGTLPVDAFSKYNNMSRNTLDKKLAECMKELKKYENVNKKALDQSIRDLIEVLDHRKYDAIKLTFKQVTKNFSDVFRELVPAGSGSLVWKTADRTQNDDTQPPLVESQELSRNEIDGYTGIGIKVSFGGQEGTREMQQLSGGQKSLVALAMIFAIQKCDPAPFYLFDEIDAALDAQHRKAVADMIEKLSSNAQFITTTFRPELLEHAEMCYGVIFRNKVSHIKTIDKSEAYDFVEDDATHG
uniref:Structural maintenance of chromosomes protein n=1 Tax=Pristionchus pacificus TaxID=54126 RepID=A0A2A6C9D1_PRIPA|eukprot:PDM74688.1 smc-3 [Pristionchus pacificus]